MRRDNKTCDGMGMTVRNRKRLVVSCFILFCIPVILCAQEEARAPLALDVERVVAQALVRNLSLKGNALDVESARENQAVFIRAIYPQISFNSGLSFLNEAPPGNAPQNRFFYDVTAQLAFHPRIVSDIELAILQYETQKISYQQAAQQLERAVSALFYTILLLEERIHIAEESVRIAEERAEDAQIRFDSGLLDEYNLLTAQVNVINAQTPLANARREYQESIERLNVLIGNDVAQPLRLVGQIEPQIVAFDKERITNELIPLSPAISRLEIAVDIMYKNRGVNTANFLPTIVFGYQYSQSFDNDIVSNNGGIGDGDNWTTGGGFSVTLSIPIGNLIPFSDTWVRHNAHTRAIEKAELALDEQRQNMIIDIQSLIDSLHITGQNVYAKQLNVERAERAFSVAEEGYRVGLRSILEVRDAQNQLDNARLDYLNERFTYIMTQINLYSQLGVSRDVLYKYTLQTEDEAQ